MKRIILSILCALPLMVAGQVLLYNDGAMLKIEAGATLFVEGGIQNTSMGTIDNDGIIEVQGNFINAGTWVADSPNTLKFSGTADVTVTSGTALFDSVVVAKGSGGDLNLITNGMTINRNLNWIGTNNKIILGDQNLILGNTATTVGYDSDEYVATTGNGMMQKNVTANSTFEFPIGDVTNYSPLSANYSGSAYAAANLKAKANDLTHPNKPSAATDFISRYWDINATGITGYSNTLTGTYIAADLTGTASLVKGAVYDGSEWSYADAAAGTNTVIGSTNDATADFTGTNFFGKADLKIFLAGAMPNSGVPPMNTTLSTPTQLIPLVSPYSTSPWNAPADTAASIPANTVDWILVETRDPSINIISQSSAFLRNDGVIVGKDGGALTLKNAVASAIVSVRHRNHLGIRTSSALDLINPTLHDFSLDTLNAWRNSTISNSNMRLVGTTYCLWGGNANLTGSGLTRISYLGLNNDPGAILSAMGGNNNNPVLETYHRSDLNLNRKVSYLGLANDPAVVLANMGSNNNNPRFQHLQ